MNLVIAHKDFQQFSATEVALSSFHIDPFRLILDGFVAFNCGGRNNGRQLNLSATVGAIALTKYNVVEVKANDPYKVK